VIYIMRKEKRAMATVFDVAKYIVDSLGKVTTMKLQKLVYYSQAWNLAWDDVPIFEDDFQAWANGPVCPALYHEHKGRFTVDRGFLSDKGDVEAITEDEKNTIDAVLSFYGEKEPSWLSGLTHQEKPWLEARGNCPPGFPCATTISKDTMQQYYASLIDG